MGIEEVNQQIQEETRARMRQEEILADAERQLQESQAELKRVSSECELNKASAEDDEQKELKRQFEGLLRDAAAPGDIKEADMLQLLLGELEVVKKELENDESETASLEDKQAELEKALADAQSMSRSLEADVQREQKRCEMEDELAGQSPEEQKLILVAHEQKCRTRAETLEAQIAQLQLEADERKSFIARLEAERSDLQAKEEDAQLQMQIVQEERDALRESMEMLWVEKTTIDEELQDLMQGYINLTERFAQQQDLTCEMEQLVEQKSQEISKLREAGFAA